MMELPEVRKSVTNYLTEPIARLLARTAITPNAITWFGFLLVVGAAVLIATGQLFAAGLVVLAGSFFDILDGALARYTNRVTHFGAILDSTLDRLAEAALLIAILFLYAREQSVAEILLVGAALPSSMLVSYVRARTEGIGLECQVGFFTRVERVIVLALGLLLNQIVIALAIIVVLNFITVGQRLIYAWQQTKVK
ncbi:CDP-alcohol phosphatidyltransferase family protein [Chloroflexota bacterium]